MSVGSGAEPGTKNETLDPSDKKSTNGIENDMANVNTTRNLVEHGDEISRRTESVNLDLEL